MCKVLTLHDSFKDYAGNVREFTLAAVSLEEDLHLPEDIKPAGTTLRKVLSLGISVKRDGDSYSKDLGETIAVGKARKYRDHAIFVTDPGLINNKMVQALLEQEAEYFKTNPGRYLAGYDKDHAKYIENQKLEAFKQRIGDEKVAALETAASVINDDIEGAVAFLNSLS